MRAGFAFGVPVGVASAKGTRPGFAILVITCVSLLLTTRTEALFARAQGRVGQGIGRVHPGRLVAFVVETFKRAQRNFLPDEPLDRDHQVGLLWRDQHEGVTGGLGPSSAADTMHVVLGVLGHIVVDHVRHPGHIEPARGDVGGDEDAVLAFTKTFQRGGALSLVFLGMNHRHRMVLDPEEVGNAVRPFARAGKDDHALKIIPLEQRHQQIHFLVVEHRMDGVVDRLGDRFLRRDLDALRIFQSKLSHLLQTRRQSRGKEQSLTLGRTVAHDGLDVFDEAHVEHAVHFVEHEHLDRVEMQGFGFEEFTQTSGGRDHDVRARSQGIALRPEVDAAVQDHGFEIGELTEGLNRLLDLAGEFASGLQDEHARAGVAVRAEAIKNGQDKRGGFARAGLSRGDQVAAGEDGGDGLHLDGRGLGVAEGLRAAHEAGVKSEFGKRHEEDCHDEAARWRVETPAAPHPAQPRLPIASRSTPPNVANMEPLQTLVNDVYTELNARVERGKVATYIPQLATVSPAKFGIAVAPLSGPIAVAGDADETFSIQSISKLFTLTLALGRLGDRIWARVDREPSGNAFNSIVQLEYEHGKPRNPFVNAGAIAITDVILGGHQPREAIGEILRFMRFLANDDTITIDRLVAKSEQAHGDRNMALAHFMRSYGIIEHVPAEVLGVYFHQCAIAMSCRQLAKAGLFLANQGRDPNTGHSVVSAVRARRINALMVTCGHYDGAGDFAFRVGLPGKSGVGGGIIAIVPGKAVITVWSPGLDANGNSLLGTAALELIAQRTSWSVFG